VPLIWSQRMLLRLSMVQFRLKVSI